MKAFTVNNVSVFSRKIHWSTGSDTCFLATQPLEQCLELGYHLLDAHGKESRYDCLAQKMASK